MQNVHLNYKDRQTIKQTHLGVKELTPGRIMAKQHCEDILPMLFIFFYSSNGIQVLLTDWYVNILHLVLVGFIMVSDGGYLSRQ